MNQSLVFKDVAFNPVDRSGEPWLRVSQIATAFGYAQPSRLTEVYTRHSDEFSSTMTALVDLETPGGGQTVRIFSLRGAHLLGMFARTDRAKEFRRWVLNVLESYGNDQPMMQSLPAPSIDKDTELAIKQRARVLAESFYPLYCLQMRHAVKSGQIAPAHVASWLPAAGTAGPPPSNEPNSRWFCWYTEQGFLTMKKLTEDDFVYKRSDIAALGEAIKTFNSKYDTGWIAEAARRKHSAAN